MELTEIPEKLNESKNNTDDLTKKAALVQVNLEYWALI